MNEPKEKRWAGAKATKEFIDLQSYSGYRSSVIDSSGKNYDLSPVVEDHELGAALLDTLAGSRFLSVEETYALIGKAKESYEGWVADKMRRHGYKNRKALFKNMKSCSVVSYDGMINISPSHHEKLEGWSGAAEEDRVSLAADSSPAEIGAALRLAFSYCTG